MFKRISNTLDTLILPVQDEIKKAQQKSIERIRQTLFKAEAEASRDISVMTSEQRFQAAEKELANAEEHILSALGSIFKSLCYLTPPVNQLINNLTPTGHIEKEIKGKVLN